MTGQALHIITKKPKKFFFHSRTARIHPKDLTDDDFSHYIQSLIHVQSQLMHKTSNISEEHLIEVFDSMRRFSENCIHIINADEKPMLSEWLQDPRMITLIALINVLAESPSTHAARYSKEFTNYYKSLSIDCISQYIYAEILTYYKSLSYLPEAGDRLNTSVLHQLSLIKNEAKAFKRLSKKIKAAEDQINRFFSYQVSPPKIDQIKIIPAYSLKEFTQWKKTAPKGSVLFIRYKNRSWHALLKPTDGSQIEDAYLPASSSFCAVLNSLENNISSAQVISQLANILKNQILFSYYSPPPHYRTASSTLTETILQQLNDVDDRVHLAICTLLDANESDNIQSLFGGLFDALFQNPAKGLRGTFPVYDENFHIEFFSKLLIILREVSLQHYSRSLMQELMRDYSAFTNEHALTQTIGKLHTRKLKRLQQLEQGIDKILKAYSGRETLVLEQKSVLLADFFKEPFLEMLKQKDDQYPVIKKAFLKKYQSLLTQHNHPLATMLIPIPPNTGRMENSDKTAQLVSITVHQAINMNWKWVAKTYKNIPPLLQDSDEKPASRKKEKHSIWFRIYHFFAGLWAKPVNQAKANKVQEPIRNSQSDKKVVVIRHNPANVAKNQPKNFLKKSDSCSDVSNKFFKPHKIKRTASDLGKHSLHPLNVWNKI